MKMRSFLLLLGLLLIVGCTSPCRYVRKYNFNVDGVIYTNCSTGGSDLISDLYYIDNCIDGSHILNNFKDINKELVFEGRICE